MDERAFEMAQKREEDEREAAIAARVRYAGESLSECLECDAEIPQGRREAVPGCRHCIDCQAEVDRLNAGVRRG